jgi:hypothetical protein
MNIKEMEKKYTLMKNIKIMNNKIRFLDFRIKEKDRKEFLKDFSDLKNSFKNIHFELRENKTYSENLRMHIEFIEVI